MAKGSGLGEAFYFGGYDLSGDVGQLNSMKQSVALLDVTGLNKFAHERIAGLKDGSIDWSFFYNRANGAAHPNFDAMPTTDVIVCVALGTSLGDPALGIIGKQTAFNYNRSAAGALQGTAQVKGNGYAGNWGRMLTAGQRTDVGATLGTGVQLVSGLPAAVNITSVAVANPGQVNATAHGLVTGDSVVLAGTTTTPSINNRYTVTVVNANQFTVPVNVTVGQGGAAGTVQQTSSDTGWSAFLQVFSFSGTDATVKIQDSADNGTFADLTGGGFVAVSSGPQAQRINAASTTATVREYVRVTTTTAGGFASLVFAVVFSRFVP